MFQKIYLVKDISITLGSTWYEFATMLCFPIYHRFGVINQWDSSRDFEGIESGWIHYVPQFWLKMRRISFLVKLPSSRLVRLEIAKSTIALEHSCISLKNVSSINCCVGTFFFNFAAKFVHSRNIPHNAIYTWNSPRSAPCCLGNFLYNTSPNVSIVPVKALWLPFLKLSPFFHLLYTTNYREHSNR